MNSPSNDPAERFRRLLPWIRSLFPQLGTMKNGARRVYLDNAAGTLLPESVAEAMADAALWTNPQPDRAWPNSPETKRMHRAVRGALRDFLSAPDGDPIFLSESTTASFYKLREALEPAWRDRANLVVTDFDHFANISPWEWRARWEVRRARMRRDGGLDLEHFASQLDEETALVAITLAGNGVGTIIPVRDAVALVRERAPRARVVADAVHAAPHLPIDVASLGVDALGFSMYKLFGPFCGVLWMRAELLEGLSPYRVEPHVDPETLLEWGTLNNVTAAGAGAALEYLRGLGTRLEGGYVGQLTEYARERRLYKIALSAIRSHESALSERLLRRLGELAGVELLGIREPERIRERVPTFAFTVAGVADQELEARLWDANHLQVAAGSHYSGAVLRGFERAGIARASFAHYNDLGDVEALIAGLERAV